VAGPDRFASGAVSGQAGEVVRGARAPRRFDRGALQGPPWAVKLVMGGDEAAAVRSGDSSLSLSMPVMQALQRVSWWGPWPALCVCAHAHAQLAAGWEWQGIWCAWVGAVIMLSTSPPLSAIA